MTTAASTTRTAICCKRHPNSAHRLDRNAKTVRVDVVMPEHLKNRALAEAGKRDMTLSAFVRYVLEERWGR